MTSHNNRYAKECPVCRLPVAGLWVAFDAPDDTTIGIQHCGSSRCAQVIASVVREYRDEENVVPNEEFLR